MKIASLVVEEQSAMSVFFHSFILEGLPSNELLKFAKSIKMDQTVRLVL